MFLLALLYDLQGPDDDGSCQGHVSEVSCLQRKSLFDSTQTYCKWSAALSGIKGDDADSMSDLPFSCSYNEIDMSFEVINYCAVVGSVFTALLMRPMDYLFQTLSSPLQDSQPVMTADDKDSKGRFSKKSMLLSTRKLSKFVPIETHLAHDQALASINIYAYGYLQRSPTRGELKADTDTPNDFERRRAHAVDGSDYILPNSHDNKLMSLMDAITTTRKTLAMGYPTNITLDTFDERWNIDPTTGYFRQQDHNMGNGKTTKILPISNIVPITTRHQLVNPTITMIRNELKVVRNEIEKKTLELKNIADDEHQGMEILNVFILDLLGRDTPEANIYREKINEDYKTMRVVSKAHKCVSALMLFALNVFFIYFAMLRGYQKGFNWQKAYLITCVLEVIADVLVFQTAECLYVNVFLPKLISRHRLDRVLQIFEQCIKNLCESAGSNVNVCNERSHHNIINMPDHLFVSTNVAKRYPTLIESAMILSYRSHLPSESLCSKWQSRSITPKEDKHVLSSSRSYSTIAFFASIALVRLVGTIPLEIQKTFIRFVQPILLSGTLIMSMRMRQQVGLIEALISLIGTLSMIGLLFWAYSRYYAKSANAPMLIPQQAEGKERNAIQEKAGKITFDSEGEEVSLESLSDFMSSNQSLYSVDLSISLHSTIERQAAYDANSIASDDWMEILKDQSSNVSSDSKSSAGNSFSFSDSAHADAEEDFI
jgi:hypothetical protein